MQHEQIEQHAQIEQHTQIEQIEDGTYYGSIPDFQRVWSNAATEEASRQELREVLEGWILLQIADHTRTAYNI